MLPDLNGPDLDAGLQVDDGHGTRDGVSGLPVRDDGCAARINRKIPLMRRAATPVRHVGLVTAYDDIGRRIADGNLLDDRTAGKVEHTERVVTVQANVQGLAIFGQGQAARVWIPLRPWIVDRAQW